MPRGGGGRRPYVALYIGGMGIREQNFYNDLAVRLGFEQAAAIVQDLYLAGSTGEAAAAAVPFEFIDGDHRCSARGNGSGSG